jgi:hypothetical protein
VFSGSFSIFRTVASLVIIMITPPVTVRRQDSCLLRPEEHFSPMAAAADIIHDPWLLLVLRPCSLYFTTVAVIATRMCSAGRDVGR